MTLRLAIVADDLTGALDTSAPFVAAGFRVAVATTVEAISKALEGAPDVLSVNTASRALEPGEAARRVERAAAMFMPHAPAMVMKKVDSRLKGNIGPETAALARAAGRTRVIAAPAVPDQGRATAGGMVTGRGLATPLPVLPRLEGVECPVEIMDASSDADLDRIAAARDWTRDLAVGARGLGAALARLSGGRLARAGVGLVPSSASLFAFGSRDPITDRQVARLAEDHGSLDFIEAPDGRFDPDACRRLPLALHCAGEGGDTPEAVAARFARCVATVVAERAPDTLVMGGGDTALAILTALGADVLHPRGEAAPGLPWFEIALPHGKTLRCVVKSGGFGTVDVLSGLLPGRVSEWMES